MKPVICLVLILLPLLTFAQSPVATRLSGGYDIGMGYSKDKYNPSVSYYQLINIGEKKIFSLGWTARLGAFYGNNLDYYTAPALLTRGKSGFNALSGPVLVENIDTVRYDRVSMTSLNFGIRAQIRLGIVEVGASADLLGATFGKARTGRYQSSTGQYVVDDSTFAYQGDNTFQKSRPSILNARLLGDNNLGTLSSELYARVRVSQRIGIKVGYQWLTTEMRVSNRDIISDNNRFRNRANMAYLAVTIPIFN